VRGNPTLIFAGAYLSEAASLKCPALRVGLRLARDRHSSLYVLNVNDKTEMVLQDCYLRQSYKTLFIHHWQS
jgi:hypothetical protein